MPTLSIPLKVKPNCRKPQPPRRVELPNDGWAIELAVNAPPIDGKANEAVIERLADVLSVPKRTLSITHGTSGKLKRVVLDADETTCARVSAWIEGLA